MIDSARMQKARRLPELSVDHAAATGWAEAALGPRLLRSSVLVRLGVVHGFTTRRGGVSEGPFGSLNLGETWGDRPAAVATNLERVARDAGFEPARLCQVRQVHGTEVVTLVAPERRAREADGMATRAELVLGVMSADCVSLLLSDGQGRVAAAHAGWRGTVSGIAAQAVAALVALGARPAELRAALAPSIGPCCFEVQADVAGPLAAAVPESVVRRDGRLYGDLWRINRTLLLGAGLVPEHIESDPPCTCCDGERFFSYRRDGGRRQPGDGTGVGIGQHLAFICGGNS